MLSDTMPSAQLARGKVSFYILQDDAIVKKNVYYLTFIKQTKHATKVCNFITLTNFPKCLDKQEITACMTLNLLCYPLKSV